MSAVVPNAVVPNNDVQMPWYLVESNAPDAEPIAVRESYDFAHMAKIPPPPVGAHIEWTTEGNLGHKGIVKEVIWDLVRGIVRVVVSE